MFSNVGVAALSRHPSAYLLLPAVRPAGQALQIDPGALAQQVMQALTATEGFAGLSQSEACTAWLGQSASQKAQFVRQTLSSQSLSDSDAAAVASSMDLTCSGLLLPGTPADRARQIYSHFNPPSAYCGTWNALSPQGKLRQIRNWDQALYTSNAPDSVAQQEVDAMDALCAGFPATPGPQPDLAPPTDNQQGVSISGTTFIFIAALAVGAYLLWRSSSSQIHSERSAITQI